MMARLRETLTRAARARLARDTAVMSLGYFGRVGVQAVYFIVIARTLGVSSYGGFIAIVAMVSVLTPFAGNGGPTILLKNVSRDRSALGVYWGNGLVLVLATGLFFTAVLVGFGPLVIGVRLRLAILCVALSELVFGRITELAGFAWTALGEMREAALLNIYTSLSRLLCVVALALLTRHPTLQDWAFAVMYGSLACCGYSVWRITWIGRPSFDWRRLKQGLGEGAYFAAGSAAATFYNDIDKTMLARMSDLASTGIYGAAYRLVDVSMAPIKAMTSSTYAESFRRGAHGIRKAEAYAYSLIRRAAWIGLALSVALFAFAPLLPYIVGRSFSRSVEALRWLALLPLLRSGHYFLGDALTGAGLNATRTVIQVVVAVLNIALNLYFIRHWSWRGAAWTSLMCDGLLVVAFAGAARIACWFDGARRNELTGSMESGRLNSPHATVESADA